MSVDIILGSSLTPFSRTVWFRTVMPREKRYWAASSVVQVISRGWLKCVCMATCLPIERPRLLKLMKVSVQLSLVRSRILIGQTARPFVAKRIRWM